MKVGGDAAGQACEVHEPTHRMVTYRRIVFLMCVNLASGNKMAFLNAKFCILGPD
jgi:hypothetical protein